MKQRQLALELTAVLLAAPASVALAQSGSSDHGFRLPQREPAFEPGLYVGGGVGYFRVDEQDFFEEGDDLDDDRAALKVYFGGDLLPWLAVEGGYVSFGEIGNGSTLEGDGWTLAAIGQLPIGNFAPYAKLGYMWWDADRSAPNVPVDNNDGHDWFGGLGLRFALTRAMDLRVEYERYQMDDADIDMASLNLQLTF